MNHSNFKKHLTLSALFAAGTMLSYTAHAEDTSVSVSAPSQISDGGELAAIITAEGERMGTLTKNINATANLGELKGTQLTIDGGETNKYGISGTYQENGTEKHYEGITVGDGKKLFINNVGSVDDTTGNIINSWNGFARVASSTSDARGVAISNYKGTVEIKNSAFSNNSADADAIADAIALGGAIYNVGTVEISNSIFSNNYATATATANATAYADARGGAIYNVGTVEISNSIFSNNYAKATSTSSAYAYADAIAYGGAIYNYLGGTVKITDSSFSNNYATATATADADAYATAYAYGGAIFNDGTVEISNSIFSNNYATATATADADAYATAYAYGGAIFNERALTITDSSFSNNYATATATADAYAYGGAIYNGSGTVNIIASTKDSIFSGNKTITNDIEAKNDIYNYSGTINLYAASGKTISFNGGIVSEGTSSAVNINVKGETGTYTDNDVAGTVLFETGSINSGNNFTLGAGTLKLENDVTWTNNTLAMNGGTLDIGSSTESEIGRLNYYGGSLTLNAGANINIDISETGHDQIVFSNSAQFILNGGKITVDLNKSVSVGDKFEILKVFILGGSNQDLSTLVVEVANAPDYILAASIIEEEDGSTNSLLLTVAAIPEPSMFGLFAGFAALALVGTRRRRK